MHNIEGSLFLHGLFCDKINNGKLVPQGALRDCLDDQPVCFIVTFNIALALDVCILRASGCRKFLGGRVGMHCR